MQPIAFYRLQCQDLAGEWRELMTMLTSYAEAHIVIENVTINTNMATRMLDEYGNELDTIEVVAEGWTFTLGDTL